MPQKCIGTRPSDSPLVGVRVQVSKDASLFKWMLHGEGTYYKAVLVKNSGPKSGSPLLVQTVQVVFLSCILVEYLY